MTNEIFKYYTDVKNFKFTATKTENVVYKKIIKLTKILKLN
jgi:hypothetical protein